MLHMPYLNAGTFECGKLESFAAGVFNLCPYLSGDWSRDSEEYISAVPNSNFGYFRPKFLRQSKLEILSWLEISFSLYCFINILFVMVPSYIGSKSATSRLLRLLSVDGRGHPWPRSPMTVMVNISSRYFPVLFCLPGSNMMNFSRTFDELFYSTTIPFIKEVHLTWKKSIADKFHGSNTIREKDSLSKETTFIARQRRHFRTI